MDSSLLVAECGLIILLVKLLGGLDFGPNSSGDIHFMNDYAVVLIKSLFPMILGSIRLLDVIGWIAIVLLVSFGDLVILGRLDFDLWNSVDNLFGRVIFQLRWLDGLSFCIDCFVVENWIVISLYFWFIILLFMFCYFSWLVVVYLLLPMPLLLPFLCFILLSVSLLNFLFSCLIVVDLLLIQYFIIGMGVILFSSFVLMNSFNFFDFLLSWHKIRLHLVLHFGLLWLLIGREIIG